VPDGSISVGLDPVFAGANSFIDALQGLSPDAGKPASAFPQSIAGFSLQPAAFSTDQLIYVDNSQSASVGECP
jgi:hypothetical protein